MFECLPCELWTLVEHMPADAGLHHHDVDGVADRVVELSGQTGSFLEHEPFHRGLLLPVVQLDGGALGGRQVPSVPGAVTEEHGHDERDDDAEEGEQIHGSPVREGVSGDGGDHGHHGPHSVRSR